jgi:hypothetical protein
VDSWLVQVGNQTRAIAQSIQIVPAAGGDCCGSDYARKTSMCQTTASRVQADGVPELDWTPFDAVSYDQIIE